MAEYGFWSEGELVLTPPLGLLVTSMSLSREHHPQGLFLTWRLRTILASPHFNKRMIHVTWSPRLAHCEGLSIAVLWEKPWPENAE